eukprot:198397-Prymnesium_polylepis.1
MLFAGQSANGGGIPTFQQSRSGIILAPGQARLECACGRDCGAVCKPNYGGSCSGHPEVGDCRSCCRGPYDEWCDGCGWKGPALSSLFERLSRVQEYNEIVVDTVYWMRNLPMAVEAFVGPKSKSAHRAFLEEYRLTAQSVPLLTLDTYDWETPFKT